MQACCGGVKGLKGTTHSNQLLVEQGSIGCQLVEKGGRSCDEFHKVGIVCSQVGHQ